MGAGDGLPWSWTQSYVETYSGVYYRFSDVTLHRSSATDPIAWKSTGGTSATRIVFDYVEVCLFAAASRSTGQQVISYRAFTDYFNTELQTGLNGLSQNYTGSGNISGSVHPFATAFRATGLSALAGHNLTGVTSIASGNLRIKGVTSGSWSTSVCTINTACLSVLTLQSKEIRKLSATNATDATHALVLPSGAYTDSGTQYAASAAHTYGPWIWTLGSAHATGFTPEYKESFLIVRAHQRGITFNDGGSTDLLVSHSAAASTDLLPFADKDVVELHLP